MENYNPKGFAKIFESELGQGCWKYLNSEDAKIRMVLATELGHPAAEGIGDKILELFGDELKKNTKEEKDRIKQAIGHMIRYVMEGYGYHLDQRSVPCRKKTELFIFASRYKK